MPQAMFTQLEKLNWNGKKVKPFTTHEGSGLGNVINDLKDICDGAIILDEIAIQGSSVNSARDKIKDWLEK